MNLKLRMLQGQFQKASGRRADEIRVRQPMYFIGSDSSCNLRCSSTNVSSRHCAIMTEGEFVSLHDLNSENGVYLNDHRINGSAVLSNGDLIRVGNLEFEIVLEGLSTTPVEEQANSGEGGRWRGAPQIVNPEPPPEDVDKMDGDITEMLVREDENARKRRLSHPDELRYDTRELQARNRAISEAEAERSEPAATPDDAKAKPGKLPKPQAAVVKGADATEAAQEMLSKVFKPRL